MIVYHGSNQEVREPICDYSERDDLDFGQGFYVTMDRDEAETWAIRKVDEHGGYPIINIYTLDDSYDENYQYKLFETDDEWFDFLDHCRGGEIEYMIDQYVIVEGEVADDGGFEAFESYHNGEMNWQETLEELRRLPLGNQICFRTDEVIQQYLEYNDSEPV